MKKCILWFLLTVLLLGACTSKEQDFAKDEPRPKEPTSPQSFIKPHAPTNHTPEPTQAPEQQEPWYAKIKVSQDFDEWCVQVTEWNKVFYYITEDGLYRWDPVTEKEILLATGEIRGLFVYDEHFYYYTDFEIFELAFGEENTSVPIWEHPERFTDPYSMGICGLMIHGDWFYIKDSGTTAIRYNPQSKSTEEFPSDFSSLVFVQDTCYYIDKANKTFTIYKLDQRTNESTIVRGDGVNKKYGDSSEPHYDELRSIHRKLYYYIRETGQYYRFDDSGNDVKFRDHAWILGSYTYPNMCYYIKDGNYIRVYEEDEFGNAGLILSIPKEQIHTGSYLAYILVTESAVFYRAGDNAPVQFAWKYSGK